MRLSRPWHGRSDVIRASPAVPPAEARRPKSWGPQPPAPGTAPFLSRPRAFQRSLPEGILDPSPHLVEVDSDGPQSIRVRPNQWAGPDDLDYAPADGLSPNAHAAKDAPPGIVLLDQNAEEEMLGADVVVTEGAGLGLGRAHRIPGGAREPLEHGYLPRLSSLRPAYLLWTACLLTPRTDAISCHDQP
jgi:hypothetical protein